MLPPIWLASYDVGCERIWGRVDTTPVDEVLQGRDMMESHEVERIGQPHGPILAIREASYYNKNSQQQTDPLTAWPVMENLDTIDQIGTFTRSAQLSAVLFYAEWCPLGLLMRTSFEVAEIRLPTISFGKARLDLLKKTDLVIPVFSTPSTSLFRASKLLHSTIEFMPPDALCDVLDGFARITLHTDTRGTGKSPNLNLSDPILLKLNLPTDLTQYRNFCKVTVLNYNTQEIIGELEINRATTVILLFLDHAKRRQPGVEFLTSKGLTAQGARALIGFRGSYNFGSARLVGIEKGDSDDQQGAYMSKNINKINKTFLSITGRKIIRSAGGRYSLIDGICVEVLKL